MKMGHLTMRVMLALVILLEGVSAYQLPLSRVFSALPVTSMKATDPLKEAMEAVKSWVSKQPLPAVYAGTCVMDEPKEGEPGWREKGAWIDEGGEAREPAPAAASKPKASAAPSSPAQPYLLDEPTGVLWSDRRDYSDIFEMEEDDEPTAEQILAYCRDPESTGCDLDMIETLMAEAKKKQGMRAVSEWIAKNPPKQERQDGMAVYAGTCVMDEPKGKTSWRDAGSWIDESSSPRDPAPAAASKPKASKASAAPSTPAQPYVIDEPTGVKWSDRRDYSDLETPPPRRKPTAAEIMEYCRDPESTGCDLDMIEMLMAEAEKMKSES